MTFRGAENSSAYILNYSADNLKYTPNDFFYMPNDFGYVAVGGACEGRILWDLGSRTTSFSLKPTDFLSVSPQLPLPKRQKILKNMLVTDFGTFCASMRVNPVLQ